MGKPFAIVVRFFLAAVLLTGVVLTAFTVYKGSQPMHIPAAEGMTYWDFLIDRWDAIAALPAGCRRTHVAGYLLTVPVYPWIYTLVGLYPDSNLARHTRPSPFIPQHLTWKDAPRAWWELVEDITWEAWVIPHLAKQVPECVLRGPLLNKR